MDATNIQPGDLYIGDELLYESSPTDPLKDRIVDDVIKVVEGDLDTAHIEIYAGDGKSWASRNGIGVGLYDLRLDGLMHVRRPVHSLDLDKVTGWFNEGMKGLPYGWCDILVCVDIKGSTKGIDCSHFAAALLEVGQCPQFDDSYPQNKIRPRDFKLSRESFEIWTKTQTAP